MAPLGRHDFLRMVEEKRAVATKLQEDRRNCFQAWMAAGFAVEFALKAAIMRRGGMNGWPDPAARPELHTHDLRKLLSAAGIDLKTCPASMRAKWKTALSWHRGQEYAPSARMPRRVARDMVEAVFGGEGVCAWLLTQ